MKKQPRTLRNGVKKQELDTDIQREYNRQRDYLEKSVDNLKRKPLKQRKHVPHIL